MTVTNGDQPTINVDGAGFVPYTGPVAVPTDGVHTVQARNAAGDQVESVFAIDTAGPLTSATVVPSAAPGWAKPA